MWYTGWVLIGLGVLLQINITIKFVPILADISTWIIVAFLVVGAFLLAFSSKGSS